MQVYKCINAVQTELAKAGISKTSRNQAQGYNFRGIDAVYNALSPMLAANGLCILPRMLSRTCEERLNKSGNALFYVTVEAEFDFVAAEDGSKHVVRTYGEAMDSGDKATNKAMSAAYKYAAMQAFAIPTEGDNDTENHSFEGENAITSKNSKSAPTKTFLKAVEINNFILAMESSSTVEALREEYTKAYKAADQIFDQAAIDKFIAIKDKKLKELQDKK